MLVQYNNTYVIDKFYQGGCNMDNNYKEPMNNEPVQEGNPYGEPVQNPYVETEPVEYTYSGDVPEQKPAKTGLAVAALVLGIISVVLSCLGFNIIIAIVAIILGAVYLSKKQPEKRGMAIAGIVLGIVSIALFVLLVVLTVVFAFGMLATDPLYTEMYNEILNGL